MKKIIFISLLLGIFTHVIAAELKYQVYRAPASGFNLASVLLTGEKEAMLIDAQFNKEDAYKVVSLILASGKKLTTIYISHGDPDYYFGLGVIKGVFPKAKVYATAPTIKHIYETYMKKLKDWTPQQGANAPDFLILPRQLKADTLTLEGQEIKVMGLDSDLPERSYVYVPSLQAVFGGNVVTYNRHFFIADAPSREYRLGLIKTLEGMKRLNPKTVVAAHAGPGAKEDASAIDFTIKYLKDYNEADLRSKDAKELISIMDKAYPNIPSPFILNLGAKVTKGEASW